MLTCSLWGGVLAEGGVRFELELIGNRPRSGSYDLSTSC